MSDVLRPGVRVRTRWVPAQVVVALLVLTGATPAFVQTPPMDFSTIGLQVGQRAPDFSGVDQFGRTHSLGSLLGPKGAMLVFFRSADW